MPVISVGEDYWFGHPSPRVLERLAGTLVLRTDQHGNVRLSTDGGRMRVEVERVSAAAHSALTQAGSQP